MAGLPPPRLWQRLFWFLLLWAMGVAAVTIVSVVLRAWIAPK